MCCLGYLGSTGMLGADVTASNANSCVDSTSPAKPELELTPSVATITARSVAWTTVLGQY